MQRIGLAVAGGLAFALAQADDRRAAIFTGVQPVASGLVNRERQVGSIHLVGVVLVEAAHTNVDRARRKLHLHGMVIQVQERNAGVFAQANHG